MSADGDLATELLIGGGVGYISDCRAQGYATWARSALPIAPATPRSARYATSPQGCVLRRKELKGLCRPVAAFNGLQPRYRLGADPVGH
jgi:hypothetical protein